MLLIPRYRRVVYKRRFPVSYQALYRKWRPTGFSDVKGQDHIVTTLRNQIKADRVGHAYLFCGTRGTGKTTVAKIFAKAVNCENPDDGNPCGQCPSCRAIAAGTSMNVIEIDAASNNGVDNIREIREEVQYSPTEGRYKVYIIDEVHMLSIGAFNALLKTLEEPPAYVIFILATTEAHKIPITILSRCQRYDFHRISADTITARLTELMNAEKVNVEERALRYIAKAADGSMRDALSLIDQCIAFYLGQDLKYENVLEVLGAVDTTVFENMLSLIVQGDAAGCMGVVEQLIMQGRELGQFVNDFIWYLRNILLIKTTDDTSKLTEIIDVSDESLKQLTKQAELVDENTLMRYIRVLSELANDLKFAVQKRIKLEIALIKLCRPAMESADELSELAGRISLLENQLEQTRQKLKEGAFVSAAASGGGQAVKDGAQDKKPAEKRVIEALPDDVRQIAAQWNSIVNTVDDQMLAACLRQCNVTLAADGSSLELMVKSTSIYNAVSRDADRERLKDIIEERTGIRVNIIVTKLAEEEDFQNRFTDIRELVNMDIEVDDKEEFI